MHSRTAAWVAHARVLGPAPARAAGRTHASTDRAGNQLVADIDAARDPDRPEPVVELEDVSERAGSPAARTAAASPAVPSPAADAPVELVVASLGELVSVLDRERVERYQAAATSPNTVRANRHDWSEWTSWCAEHTYTPLLASPGVIAASAGELAAAARTLPCPPARARRRSRPPNTRHSIT